eukprot:m.737051 g.737051  ORF g.737051 m.737051 type:complete len:196 (-) comp58903_c0_seq2:100-687(-)
MRSWRGSFSKALMPTSWKRYHESPCAFHQAACILVCTAALSVATISGHTACVRILLRRGAGITVKNRDGKTAIDLARERGRTEILDLLEEHELLLGQRRIKPALREPFKPLAPAPVQEDHTEAARILVLDFEDPNAERTADEGVIADMLESEQTAGGRQQPQQQQQQQKQQQQDSTIVIPVMNLALTDQDFDLPP